MLEGVTPSSASELLLIPTHTSKSPRPSVCLDVSIVCSRESACDSMGRTRCCKLCPGGTGLPVHQLTAASLRRFFLCAFVNCVFGPLKFRADPCDCRAAAVLRGCRSPPLTAVVPLFGTQGGASAERTLHRTHCCIPRNTVFCEGLPAKRLCA